MPITKQAIKKMRSDRTRSVRNKHIRDATRAAIKLLRKSPTVKHLSQTFKMLDKAAKSRVIHPNKASRLKSRLTKLLKKK